MKIKDRKMYGRPRWSSFYKRRAYEIFREGCFDKTFSDR
jgi:hypothetical protein